MELNRAWSDFIHFYKDLLFSLNLCIADILPCIECTHLTLKLYLSCHSTLNRPSFSVDPVECAECPNGTEQHGFCSVTLPRSPNVRKTTKPVFPSGDSIFAFHGGQDVFTGNCSVCSVAVLFLTNEKTLGKLSNCFLSCKPGMIVILLRAAVKIQWLSMWEVLKTNGWHTVSSMYAFAVWWCHPRHHHFPELALFPVSEVSHRWHQGRSSVLKGWLLVVISAMSLVKLEREFYNPAHPVFSCERAERLSVELCGMWVACRAVA